MNAQDVMSSDPYVASVSTTVREVFRIMNEADIRHLPIVDQHALVGIVSDRDVRAAIPTALDRLERPDEVARALSRPITALLSTDVLCVHPESELADVVDLMLEHKIGAVPVVEPDSLKVVGIVSYVDVLRAARELL